MAREMKYIMVDDLDLPTPIIFPDYLTHADVAKAIGKKVLSAGFVQRDSCGIFSTYGESVSLRVKSNPERDNKVIHRFLGPS